MAAISFLTAVLFANTFGLCFAAQREIVSAMSKEVFALELLLQELFIQIPEPHLRWRVIKHIKCAPEGLLSVDAQRTAAATKCNKSCCAGEEGCMCVCLMM